ncbi:MAG: hypothetical protein WAN14_13385 [Candidatus Acidiferrales bacterium]
MATKKAKKATKKLNRPKKLQPTKPLLNESLSIPFTKVEFNYK